MVKGSMESEFVTRQAPTAKRALSRRTIGVASVGAGAAALTGVVSAPAQAAAQSVTVEQATLAPAVVYLTDADTIAVDASLGNDFRVTLGGNRTIETPANSANGQQIIFQVTQGSGGPFAVTWGTGYEFSSALPQPKLSAGPGQTDLLGFIYSAAKGTWLFVAYVNGFD